LTFLRELWVWREEEARRKDRPVFKTLNSEYLIGISEWCEKTPGADIGAWPEAPRNVRGEYRDEINELIKKASQLPETRFIPEKKKFSQKRWGTAENERFKLLKIERDRLGTELKIQPSLVATNAILEILAEQAPASEAEIRSLKCLLPWQVEVAGKSFLAAINDKYPKHA
jgi:ribonuclease D